MNLPFHGKGRCLCVPHPGKDQASCQLQLQLIRYNRAEIPHSKEASFISAPWLRKPLTTDDVDDDNLYNECCWWCWQRWCWWLWLVVGGENDYADDDDWSKVGKGGIRDCGWMRRHLMEGLTGLGASHILRPFSLIDFDSDVYYLQCGEKTFYDGHNINWN